MKVHNHRGERLRQGVPSPPLRNPLRLDVSTFYLLLQQQGPSLSFWRAAEIAALRRVQYEHPVLDLGCGDGLVTAQILPYVEVGLDPDQRTVARAAQQGIYGRLETTYVEDSQLPAESVGTVFSNSVLEHIPNIDAVLTTIARLLRPGGKLVCTMPSDTFSSCLFLPFRGYATWRNRQMMHLNLWPVEQWRQHLEQAGLELEFVNPYMRPAQVWLWDALELLQQVWIGHRRAMSIVWRRIPPSVMARLAQWAAQQDFSASTQCGGRLIVARKK